MQNSKVATQSYQASNAKQASLQSKAYKLTTQSYQASNEKLAS
jgi:hypothetical protein